MRIQTAAALVALTLAGTAPAPMSAQDNKAADVLASARRAIGDKKLDSLRTLSVVADMQRNVNNMQISSEVEMLLEMPDKYVRNETMRGPMTATIALGFNGDRPLQRANAPMMGGGGGMVIRMAGPGGVTTNNEKPTPEQQEQIDRAAVRTARQELSRLTLGWFAAAHASLNAQYSYAGEAESPDGKAHVIDVKNADGFSARLFIDEQSDLPLMVTYQAPQPRIMTAGGPGGAIAGSGGVVRTAPQPSGRQLTEAERTKMREDAEQQIKEMQKQPPVMADWTVYFDDWREVDGVKFPHRMRRASGGTTTEEWIVTKVKVNPKIDPKKFAIES